MTDITELAREAGFIQAGKFLSGNTSLIGNEKDFAKLEQLLRDKFIAELGEPVAYKRVFPLEDETDSYMLHDDREAVDLIVDIPLYALKDERK